MGTAATITGPGLVRLSDSKMLVVAGIGPLSSAPLFGWEFDASANSWTVQRSQQKFDTGTNMTVSESSMAMTRGYLKDTGSTAQIVGVFADGNLTKMVRYVSSSKTWKLLTGLNNSAANGAGFWSDHKMGLAYVPYDPAVPATGRFYFLYNRNGIRAGKHTPHLVRTVGNDPNATVDPATGLEPRVLKWRNGGGEEFLHDEYFFVVEDSGHDLLYDIDYDNRLRGSEVSDTWDATLVNSINFFPMMDGSANVDLLDYDDWKTLRANLPCSLGGCSRR
jgi:hypothetical protein